MNMIQKLKGKSLFQDIIQKFRDFMHKFKDKNFVQDILIEIVADLLMLCIGIVVGYYIKSLLF